MHLPSPGDLCHIHQAPDPCSGRLYSQEQRSERAVDALRQAKIERYHYMRGLCVPQEISKIVGDMWQRATPEEKAPYVEEVRPSSSLRQSPRAGVPACTIMPLQPCGLSQACCMRRRAWTRSGISGRSARTSSSRRRRRSWRRRALLRTAAPLTRMGARCPSAPAQVSTLQ